jgi:hypothetical protein
VFGISAVAGSVHGGILKCVGNLRGRKTQDYGPIPGVELKVSKGSNESDESSVWERIPRADLVSIYTAKSVARCTEQSCIFEQLGCVSTTTYHTSARLIVAAQTG